MHTQMGGEQAPDIVTPCWEQMCQAAAEVLTSLPAGPMDTDLVITPSTAHARSLSGHLATHGPQICAGLDFDTPHHFYASLVWDSGKKAPGWGTAAMNWLIIEALAGHSADPDFAGVQRFLHPGNPRPGRRYATGNRVAGLLRGYLVDAPDMLRAWSAGNLVGPDSAPLAASDRWQAIVWREVVAELASDPIEAHDRVVTELSGKPHPDLPERIVVCQIDDQPAHIAELFTALGHHHRVTTIRLGTSLPVGAGGGSPFAQHYCHRARVEVAQVPPAHSMLTLAQHAMMADRPMTEPLRADGSVQIHLSHGIDRQVEVLRDVICAALSGDATLQPRDIVVLCPDPDRYAPYIEATMGVVDQADHQTHPGHLARVQIASDMLAVANPALGLLRQIIGLYTARADALQFINLLNNPLVAARFGLGSQEQTIAAHLIGEAQIRWGLDGTQRRRNRVGLDQSTWFEGIQRLLLSIALDANPPVAIRQYTPVAQVAMGDSPTIGILAEVVSRLRRIFLQLSTPAPATQWAERLRAVLDDFIVTQGADQQVSLAMSRLAEWADESAGLAAEWDLGDVTGWLDEQIAANHRRPNYGNGSLLITRLGDMRMIEKRVVIILGLDDTFPGTESHDGDNLLVRSPGTASRHWTARLRARNQQSLADAVLAAQDRLVLITQAIDPQNGLRLPAPLACLDLLEALGLPGSAWENPGSLPDGLVVAHGLQPHAPGEFAGDPPNSFDQAALSGARVRGQPQTEAVPHWRLRHRGGDESHDLDLAEVEAFYRDPARALLRRAGVDLRDFTEDHDPQLPIQPDLRQQWPVGKEIFDSLIAGVDVETARRQAWLGGQVLAGQLGGQVIDHQAAAAEQVAEQVRAVSTNPRTVHVRFDLDRETLHGAIRLHDHRVVVHRFGWLKPTDAITAWLRLAALSASRAVDRPEAILVGKGRNYRLLAPEPDQAAGMLREFTGLRRAGLRQIVPLNPAWAGAFTGLFTFKSNNPQWRLQQAMTTCDANWEYFYPDTDTLLTQPVDPTDPGVHDDPSRFVVLSRWLVQPILDALRVFKPGGRP